MAKVSVYNLQKNPVGEIELSDAVFGAEVNEPLMYDVLKAQLASRRAGTAKTKTRPEVSGSTRKLYRQKGTGAARHGAIRAAQYVGGGRVHGPQPRDYSYRPPRKMRAGALASALSLKLKQGQLFVVDGFQLSEVKTKQLASILKAFDAGSSLIVDGKANDKLRLSARNLEKSQFLPPEGVNLYDILRHEHLILTKDAVTELQNRLENS
ncbi:MAG TPA: 50S ribosomal protein L4 [Polyangiales bacterium]|nr:50S ribosomal protein L4 [Polyangiales bacterium]